MVKFYLFIYLFIFWVVFMMATGWPKATICHLLLAIIPVVCPGDHLGSPLDIGL